MIFGAFERMVAFRYLRARRQEGFVSVIAIFSGATLFALGIMGEYLARIYAHSMGQPPYVIREE